MKKIILLASLVLFSVHAYAQDTAFTYHGQLISGSTAANGGYDLRFALFDAASGGLQQGNALTNTATAVSIGVFAVTLDFGNQFPGAERWLEIQVRTNGNGAFTTLAPRQQITSAPYAIQSANAISAVGVSGAISAGQLTGTISSNNIGAGSITTTMLAAGAVGSNQLAAGAVTTSALADNAVTAPKVATITNWFAQTIPNPTPQEWDQFGGAVAAFGADRMLIGAAGDDTGGTDAGVVHLYNTNGTLLTIFTNPAPVGDGFGISVAAMGLQRVLIGAPYGPNGGVVYLFRTNGVLLNTFTNPAPEPNGAFGYSIAAVGTDRVLISAMGAGPGDYGAAYLFHTNGTLITTFNNPSSFLDAFAFSVAALGTERVVISAYGTEVGGVGDVGVAYLFNTNGTLIRTFTNPTPAQLDWFGWSVAAFGTDRVLIGNFRDAAYLFHTNGALLATFSNSVAGNQHDFGACVAAIGLDRIMVGAPNFVNVGGAAFLYNTNGTLLTVFTNPTPATYENFGRSFAAVGNNQVLIGALNDSSTGANFAGAAYLYGLETYAPGLITDGVNARSITTTSLEDGAVTLSKLDSTIGVWTRTGDNVFRTVGNVGIGTSSFTSNRLEVAGAVGATVFNTTSDRAVKADFLSVDAQTILDKVAALPITQWSFKEYPGMLHLGPTAQDFHAAFGLGASDKSISTVDADGVALAAIQGLNEKVEVRGQKSEDRIQKLETENAELKARLEKLEQLLEHKFIGDGK